MHLAPGQKYDGSRRNVNIYKEFSHHVNKLIFSKEQASFVIWANMGIAKKKIRHFYLSTLEFAEATVHSLMVSNHHKDVTTMPVWINF